MKSQNSHWEGPKTEQHAGHWKRRTLLVSGVIIALAAALLVSACVARGSSAGSIQRSQTISIDMTTRTYPSLKALTQRASLIVIGQVVGNGKAKWVAQPHSSGPDQGLPETTFSFQITQILKGSVPLNQHISIFQVGGTFTEQQGTNGPLVQRTYVADNQPLLAANEDTLLFLDVATEGPDVGSYYILGGEEGRYTVSQGKVHPFLPLTKHLIGHDGDTVSTFGAAIAAANK